MARVRRLALIGRECVACGCCVRVCPRQAIHIHRGITAQVDSGRCVGCGKCAAACPAAVIEMAEREAEA